MRTVLCLTGGGALGAFQAGFLRAYQLGINAGTFERPTDIVGISVGALNASLAALNHRDFSWVSSFWFKNIRKPEHIAYSKNIFTRIVPGLLSGKFNGLVDPRPLEGMIDRYVGDNMLSESPITAHAGACKLKDGSINYFTQHHENYSKYLLASASIPAIFPAVKIDGDVWVDGGLVEVAPVDRCIRLHADRIIVVSCYPEESGVVDFNESNPWELADRIMAVATNTILRNNIRQIESVNKRVLEAVGAISGMLSIMPPDFNDKASVDEMVGLEKSIRGVAGKRYLEVYKVQPEERLDYNTGDFKDKNIVSAIDAGFNQGLKLITEVEVTSRRMRS